MRSTYGLNIVYVRLSAIFSTPRCRYPMTHSSPRTFSPSSLRMTRSTPCVAGCCGPILMTSSFASRYVFSCALRSSGEIVRESVIYDFGLSMILCVLCSESYSPSLSALDPQVDLHPLVVLLQNPIIFAQRMTLPSIRQQNPFHIRMPIELDSEHVVHLA